MSDTDFNAGVRAALAEVREYALSIVDGWARQCIASAANYAEHETLGPEAPARPMTGLWALLTEEQRAEVLAYDGDETIGDPAFSRGTP